VLKLLLASGADGKSWGSHEGNTRFHAEIMGFISIEIGSAAENDGNKTHKFDGLEFRTSFLDVTLLEYAPQEPQGATKPPWMHKDSKRRN